MGTADLRGASCHSWLNATHSQTWEDGDPGREQGIGASTTQSEETNGD